MNSGKVAIVTGASSGIGKETALLLGKQGYFVVLAARRADAMEDIRKQIESGGGKALAVQTDVSLEADVQRMVDQTMAQFGRIDVLVNNAGSGLFAPVWETSGSQMERIWKTNCLGTFYCISKCLPIMKKQNSGHILAVASVVGKRATPLNSAYCSSKFAQVGLMESLRMELRNTSIRSTVICPSATESDFISVIENPGSRQVAHTGPVQTSRQVAKVIVGAIGTRKVEIMTQPATRILVMLNSVSPRFVDWLVGKVKRKSLESL